MVAKTKTKALPAERKSSSSAKPSLGSGRAFKVVHINAKDYMTELKERIHQFEVRYETTSEQMLDLISADRHPETAEILKWMMDYHELRWLEKKTRMGGTRTTTTKKSTKKD